MMPPVLGAALKLPLVAELISSTMSPTDLRNAPPEIFLFQLPVTKPNLIRPDSP